MQAEGGGELLLRATLLVGEVGEDPEAVGGDPERRERGGEALGALEAELREQEAGARLERGDAVTAVLRRPAPDTDPRVAVRVIPDFSDTAALRAAIEGADAVLSAIGPRSRKDAPVAAPATRHILAAEPDLAAGMLSCLDRPETIRQAVGIAG